MTARNYCYVVAVIKLLSFGMVVVHAREIMPQRRGKATALFRMRNYWNDFS